MNIGIIDETAFIGLLSLVAGTFLAIRVRAKKEKR